MAGVGLCFFATTLVFSNHPVRAAEFDGNYKILDTTPKKKKDSTKKKPDSMNLNLSSPATSQK